MNRVVQFVAWFTLFAAIALACWWTAAYYYSRHPQYDDTYYVTLIPPIRYVVPAHVVGAFDPRADEYSEGQCP